MKYEKLILNETDYGFKVNYYASHEDWKCGGIYCNVYILNGFYVITTTYSGKPRYVCDSLEQLMKILKTETGCNFLEIEANESVKQQKASI